MKKDLKNKINKIIESIPTSNGMYLTIKDFKEIILFLCEQLEKK